MTLDERAKQLVDGVASRLDARATSNEELGFFIAREVDRVAPGNRKFLDAVVGYMAHLASQNCGPGATHDCKWRGGRSELQ